MHYSQLIMVLSDNGKTSRYTYNHAGERAVKSHGSMEKIDQRDVDKYKKDEKD